MEEVTKLFLSVFIDINKVSHGSDNIALRILKECNEDLAGPLATLFNFCFSQRKIPAEWKATKCHANFKKNTLG